MEVSNLRVIKTSYRSPQLTLWTLGPDEWLLFQRLLGYVVRRKRKLGRIDLLPLPDFEEDQPQVASS